MHDDVVAARAELGRRLKSAETASKCLKQERLWLQTEFPTCSAQHRANLKLV